MAIELRMDRRESMFHGEDPFFIDTCPVAMQPSSVMLSKERWAELGNPEQLIVILEDAHRDDRKPNAHEHEPTTFQYSCHLCEQATAEIPVITGECEVVERIDAEQVVRPVPHARP